MSDFVSAAHVTMLAYREFAPPATLAHAVDTFWCLSPKQTITQPHLLNHRSFPDGCVNVFCRFHRTLEGRIANPTLMIYGPTDQFELVEIDPLIEFVGVRLKPGEASLLLNSSPLGLFRETVVAQDYSVNFSSLFDKLCGCYSTLQVLNLLQEFVLERMLCSMPEHSLRVREVVRLLSTDEGQMLRIPELADSLGVSERTLRRDITKSVGLSPKMLSRILRFQKVLTSLQSSSPLDLCGIALSCGYADQPHLGREFQAFAGLSPATYIRSFSR
jgi:AraC-like DNA-binding protein